MYKKFLRWLQRVTKVFDIAGKRASTNELPLEDKSGNPFEIKNQKRFM